MGQSSHWPSLLHYGEPVRVSDWLSFDEKEDRKAIFIAYREATAEVEKRVRALGAKE